MHSYSVIYDFLNLAHRLGRPLVVINHHRDIQIPPIYSYVNWGIQNIGPPVYAWSLLPVQLLQTASQGTNCSIQRFPNQWNYSFFSIRQFLTLSPGRRMSHPLQRLLNPSSTACHLPQKREHNLSPNIAPSLVSILMLKHPCSSHADSLQQIFPQSPMPFSSCCPCFNSI